MGSALIAKPILDLRDVTATLFGFVGMISPAGVEELISQQLVSLSQRSRTLSRLRIINTDGYVEDGGAMYKKKIIDKLQPDVVVLIGRNYSMSGLISQGPHQLLRTRSSTQARKSWTERRRRRLDQFVRFLGESQVVVNAEKKRFYYLGSLVEPYGIAPLFSTYSGQGLDNVFVGLGFNGTVIGYGVVRSGRTGEIEIRSDVHEFDSVYLSNIRLTDDTAEQITLQRPDQECQEW